MKTCGVYVRLDADDSNYDQYMHKMTELAKENNLTIFKVYRDDTGNKDRNQLEEMLNDISQGRFLHVVTKNFIGFGDNAAQMTNFIHRLQKLNVHTVHTYFGSFSLSDTSHEKFALNVQLCLEDFIHCEQGTSAEVKGRFCAGINMFAMCKHYETELNNFLKV